jgi:hypothetical protein
MNKTSEQKPYFGQDFLWVLLATAILRSRTTFNETTHRKRRARARFNETRREIRLTESGRRSSALRAGTRFNETGQSASL